MADLLLIIPVLGRPARARPLYESASQATDVPHRILFVCSPNDLEQTHACVATGADVELVPWEAGWGDWARKVNLAYRISDEPWLFLGADDLCFCEGWASKALARAADFGVVGTNDLGNPRVLRGEHSTHPLVRRSYADEHGTIDGPGVVCEEYDHQFVDDELVETAKARGAWTFAEDAWVEHLHPYFQKGMADATYAKATRNTLADRKLFRERRKLWT